MRAFKKCFVLAALLLVAAAFGQAAFYWNIFALDKFAYSNGNLAGNSHWGNIPNAGSLSLVSNTLQCSSAATFVNCGDQYNVTWPNDQCSQIQVNTLLATGGGQVTVGVRSSGVTENYYFAAITGPLGPTATIEVDKLVAGTFTNLIAPQTETVNSGDLVGFCAQGTKLYTTIRGASVAALSTTDSALTSGVPMMAIIANGQAATAVVLANWSGFYLGTTVAGITPPATGPPFPRIGIQMQVGDQEFPAGSGGANDSYAAQYGLVLLGGNYDSWFSSSARTRQSLVTTLHTFTHTGLHAVTPIILQYQNPSELNPSPWFAAWSTAVTNCNWYLYNTGSSGTKAVSTFNASWNVVDYGHAAGTSSSGCDGTGTNGNFPYQAMSKLWASQIITGPQSSGVSAAPALDGVVFDNQQVPILISGTTADFLRTGTGQVINSKASSNTTAINAGIVGKSDIESWWAANQPSYAVGINASIGDIVPTASGGNGMTAAAGFNNLSGLATYGFNQFIGAGTFASPNNGCNSDSLLNWAGPAATLVWYQAASLYNTIPVLTVCVNSGATTGEAQIVRYSLGMALVAGNAYMAFGNCVQDDSDYSNTTCPTPMQFDEFWGGNLNTSGYLGQPVDPVQTTPYSGSIYVRRFTGGLAAWNGSTAARWVSSGSSPGTCSGGSSGTITLPSGGPWYPLHGSNSVNPGGAAVTTATIPACDARIFVNSGPNYRPHRAANDEYFIQMLLKDAA